MNISGLDYMSLEFEFMETDLNAVECTLIVIVWILIQFLGNGLLLGLIQHDRLGEDPLKRRISDQVSLKSGNVYPKVKKIYMYVFFSEIFFYFISYSFLQQAL